MPSIGFNAINDVALEQLHEEGIAVVRRDTMIDVIAPYDYRIWKHPEKLVYYYMFRDKGRIYCAFNETGKDYSAKEITITTRCVLMPLEDEMQGIFRDRILSYPPDWYVEEGGVLK
jgi:hypothetical protein